MSEGGEAGDEEFVLLLLHELEDFVHNYDGGMLGRQGLQNGVQLKFVVHLQSKLMRLVKRIIIN